MCLTAFRWRRGETGIEQMIYELLKWLRFSSSEMTTVNTECDRFDDLSTVAEESSMGNIGYEEFANIHERSVKNEDNLDTLIHVANAFYRLQRYEDAVNVYARAFSLGTIRENHLSLFIDALCKKGKAFLETATFRKHSDVATCGICSGIIVEPLTLPCGHTYCKRCLLKESEIVCKFCNFIYKAEDLSLLKTDVTVVNVLEKIRLKEVQAAKLRLEGNDLHEHCDFLSAVMKYVEAERLDPFDHLVQTDLSDVLLAIGKPQTALDHANKAINLNPIGFKGYLCKGASLMCLGQHEEALIAFLKCLILQKSNLSLNSNIIKLLCKLLQLEQIQRLLNKDQLSRSALPESFPVEAQTNLHTILSLSTLCEDALRKQDQSEISLILWKQQKTKLERIVTRLEAEMKRIKEINAVAVVRPDEIQGSIKKKDLECSLCMRLLWQPVTTPCGHTYCRTCLDRCLDHKPHCPLCKQSLAMYLAERRHATTEIIETVMKRYLPDDYQERKTCFEEELEELSNAGKDPEHGVPLFVCTLAYPDIHCPLHIFEPRYRLMTRQCLESGTREFGMCVQLEEEENGIAKFGTMLVIRDISYYPDGRSIVDAIGTRRFKVLQTCMRDGYHVGSVEFISDSPVPDTEVNGVKQLHDEVYSEVSDWFSTVPTITRSRILQHFGPLPPVQDFYIESANGPQWMWWTLAILPIDVKAQVQILGIGSLKRRLESLRRVLRFVRRYGPQGISL